MIRIAVASGKGGTGKTTVATNLAFLAAQVGRTVVYADCDVEEPNGHLFLKPTIDRERSIDRLIPAVDRERCTLCSRCSEVCRYGAMACVGQSVLVFAELCHWLQVAEGRILRANFTTTGCESSRAAGSMAAELAVGRSLPEAARLGQQDVLQALGGLPKESEHCALLAANTLKAAIGDYQARQSADPRRGECSGVS